MALVKNKQFKKFEIDIETKSVSIAYDIVIEDDVENEILARKRFRRAFVVNDDNTKADALEGVRDWTGVGVNHPAHKFLEALWS